MNFDLHKKGKKVQKPHKNFFNDFFFFTICLRKKNYATIILTIYCAGYLKNDKIFQFYEMIIILSYDKIWFMFLRGKSTTNTKTKKKQKQIKFYLPLAWLYEYQPHPQTI